MPFKTAEEYAARDNLLVSIWGLAKAGKTSFYTGLKKPNGEILRGFPGPLYILDTDKSVEEILKGKLYDPALEGQIFVSPVNTGKLRPSINDRIATYSAAMRDLEGAATAIAKEGRGTLVIDTMTKFWQLMSDVETYQEAQKTARKEVMQFMFKVPNMTLTAAILGIKDLGANLVVVHHARPIYAENQPTGFYVPQDNNLIDQLVQIQIHQEATDRRKRDNTPYTEYTSTIDFNRWNGAMRGKSYPDLDYAMLYEETFGHAPKE